MIRINLLPVRAAQKKERLRSQIVILILSLILTMTACGAVYFSLSVKVSNVEDEIKNKQDEIVRLKKAIGQVGRFKKLQEELRGKLDVLDELKEKRTGPVRLLDELSNAIPDKVWIGSFSETNGKVSISGTGLNEENVAQFLQNIEASPYYKGVELNVIQKKTEAGRKVESFSITCSVESPEKAKKK
ncbi:MAG: fimbrial protein [Desulfuromonas sp.]|nr:MAG: fimbrial protein [Desulfuromonas sp.]